MRFIRQGLAAGTLVATLALTAMAPAANAATSHGGRPSGLLPSFYSYQFLQNAHYVNFGNCVGTWQPTSPPNPELVTIRNTFTGWIGTHRVVYNWYLPQAGSHLYASHAHVITGRGRVQFCDSIRLTGPFPGTWTVRIIVDGVVVRNVQWNIPPM